MITPHQLKSLYDQGHNISAFLRDEMGLDHNTREIIEISYDLQAGSYITAMENEEMAKHKEEYSREIAHRILSLCQPRSILEAGVGEATTLSGVLKNLGNDVYSYGFDLSWSRVAYAQKWLDSQGITNTLLCSGDLFNIPFLDNSIDIVYTSHSIEPNKDNEKPILQELYRVARKFLILLEPGYEFANDEARQRMDFHGYCKNLKGISNSLNYDVLEHKLFPFTSNPLNPTAITIIRKDSDCDTELSSGVFACPKFKVPLKKICGMLFSREALVVYPIVGRIPCLRVENGIFASKYEEVMKVMG
ncbi:MAG: class I SAM-dependent methyltransferase [Coleofasciculus sp. A1-SPW-01]|uniref:class I SAM-dependent methyltransferase n=1 Tax=Coleofasciculus sp. A1-SPW-01 TaxID=3070819 RepID=UPI0033037CC3